MLVSPGNLQTFARGNQAPVVAEAIAAEIASDNPHR
jgi:hypothetical protein